MKRYNLSQTELQRHHVVKMLIERRCSTREAADTMGITERQTKRLKQKALKLEAAGIPHGNRVRKTGRGIPEKEKQRVLELAGGKYRGFNDTHLWQKLTEQEGFQFSREALRQLLRDNGLTAARKRRPPKHRQRRPPRPQEGMLVQVDGSPHDWLEDRGHWFCLVGAIDDASSRVLWARFFPTETSEAYLHLLRGLVQRYGIPLALYSDRHGIFQANRKEWTLEEELAGRQHPTQVGQVLERLGIELITANSPQAKGRVERMWKTLQDRLVSELRLAGAKSLEEANCVLETYLEDHNQRYSHPAERPQSAFPKAPHGLDLDWVISFSYPATVGNDNAVRIQGRVFDIPPGPQRCSYVRAKVMVHRLLNGEWRIYHGERLLFRVPPSGDENKEESALAGKTSGSKMAICLASKP